MSERPAAALIRVLSSAPPMTPAKVSSSRTCSGSDRAGPSPGRMPSTPTVDCVPRNGEVESPCPPERIRSGAGDLRVVQNPESDSALVVVEHKPRGVSGCDLEGAVVVPHGQRDGYPIELFEAQLGGFEEPLRLRGFGELLAQLVEGAQAVLTSAHLFVLPAQTVRNGADQDADAEHGRERHEALGVGDGKGEVRRHEEEVEGQHARCGGDERRHPAVAVGDPGDAEEIDHDEVRAVHKPETRPREERGAEHGRASPGDPLPRRRLADSRGRRAFRSEPNPLMT